MELVFDRKKLDKAAKKYDLKFVILHGSYATGHHRQDSDLDIAVLGKKKINFSQLLKLIGDFEHIFGNDTKRELDIKTLHRVDPFFRYEVTKIGKLVFGNSTDYEEYKSFSQRAYEDAKPLFELEQILAHKYQNYLRKFIHA